MKNKEPKAPRKTVTLEPALERLAGSFTPHQRVMLAKKYFRWAKQLYVSAALLRLQAAAPRRPLAVPFLPPAKARKN